MSLSVRDFQLWIGKGISVAALALGLAGPAFAQEQPQDQAQAQAKRRPPAQARRPCRQSRSAERSAASRSRAKAPKPYGGGTPLDVLMHTKLWEDVPEAKDFVKESGRRTTRCNISRRKATTRKARSSSSPISSNSMQDELEHAGALAERSAGVRIKHFTNVHTSEFAQRQDA